MGTTLVVRKGKQAVATEIKGGKFAQKKVGPVQKFNGPNAAVEVSLMATLNMGNYESLKLGVSLSLPCDPSSAKVEEAFKKAVKFTEIKLDKMIKANKPQAQVPKRSKKPIVAEYDPSEDSFDILKD